MRRLTFATTLAITFAVFAVSASAQGTTAPNTLTLDEAIALAKRNNPAYLQAINNKRSTALTVRTARAALFPTLSSNLGFSWREGLPTIIEGQQFGSSVDQLGSNFGFGISASYSYQSFLNPGQAAARLDAADAGQVAQEQSLRQQVTDRYFIAVQSVRNAELQDTLVKSLDLQLQLAKAKEAIGSGISLETKQAEVNMLRQQLAAERASSQAGSDKLALFELIGIPTVDTNVQLTTDLPIVEPNFNADDLIAESRQRNASLSAARANLHAAEVTKKSSKGAYIPSLSLQSGIGGNTSMDMDAVGDARTWPFGFRRSPISVGASLRLPLWDGFQREQNIENAAIQTQNAQIDLKRTEIQVTNNITRLVAELQLAWRAYRLQEQIVETQKQALQLAQERYKVGSTPFTDLSLAQDRYQQEENALLVSIYTYHRTFAQLEAAVGRPLR
jgi:outer membrane protein